MRILSPLAALAAAAVMSAAVSAPALAVEWKKSRFVDDGHVYLVQEAEFGGVTHIKGRIVDTGGTFSLTVKGALVRGTMEGKDVSFRTTEIAAGELASR